MQQNISNLARIRLSSLRVLMKRLTSTVAFTIGSLILAHQPAVAEIDDPSRKPMAVHVVCLARNNDILMSNRDALAYLKDDIKATVGDYLSSPNKPGAKTKLDELLKREFPPVDAWNYLPIGSGFIVDDGQRYVVTNWHVIDACPTLARGQQIGILDPAGKGFRPILAELISSKPQTICKNTSDTCSIRKIDKTHLSKPELEKYEHEESELKKKIKFYVPDIAVLKLAEKTSVLPFTLETDPHLVGGQTVTFSGFPEVTSDLSRGLGGSARTLEVVPSIINANFSREVPVNTIAPGATNPIKATLFELSGIINDGNSGGPLIAGDRVVGIIVESLRIPEFGKAKGKPDMPAGMGLAIRSSDLIDLLRSSKVDFKSSDGKKLDVSLPAVPVSSAAQTRPVEPKTVDQKPETGNNFLVPLLAAIVLLAGGAFFFLNRKPSNTSGTQGTSGASGSGSTTSTSTGTGAKGGAGGDTKPMCAEIQGVYGVHASQSFPLPTPNGSNTLVFGRDAGTCQVVFPQNTTSVSKLHCRITWDAANRYLLVEDNNSTNGTFVNKQRIASGQSKRLSNGDVIHLGGADSKDVFKVVYKTL